MLNQEMASDSLWPRGLEPIGLLFPWDSQAGILDWVAISSSRGFSWPGGQNYIFYISYIDRQVFFFFFFFNHCTTLEGHVTLYSAKSLPLPASLMTILVQNSLQCGRPGFDPLEKGNGYPFQYSGLENSTYCIVHGVTKIGHEWATFTSLHFTSPDEPHRWTLLSCIIELLSDASQDRTYSILKSSDWPVPSLTWHLVGTLHHFINLPNVAYSLFSP